MRGMKKLKTSMRERPTNTETLPNSGISGSENTTPDVFLKTFTLSRLNIPRTGSNCFCKPEKFCFYIAAVLLQASHTCTRVLTIDLPVFGFI